MGPVNMFGEIEQIMLTSDMVLLYFTSPACQVCKVVKPKVIAAVSTHFPLIRIVEVDILSQPQLSAQFSVFTIPTILVFAQGKEVLRFSRAFSVGEVLEAIERPYQLLNES